VELVFSTCVSATAPSASGTALRRNVCLQGRVSTTAPSASGHRCAGAYRLRTCVSTTALCASGSPLRRNFCLRGRVSTTAPSASGSSLRRNTPFSRACSRRHLVSRVHRCAGTARQPGVQVHEGTLCLGFYACWGEGMTPAGSRSTALRDVVGLSSIAPRWFIIHVLGPEWRFRASWFIMLVCTTVSNIACTPNDPHISECTVPEFPP
jgi:hypothetical protein